MVRGLNRGAGGPPRRIGPTCRRGRRRGGDQVTFPDNRFHREPVATTGRSWKRSPPEPKVHREKSTAKTDDMRGGGLETLGGSLQSRMHNKKVATKRYTPQNRRLSGQSRLRPFARPVSIRDKKEMFKPKSSKAKPPRSGPLPFELLHHKGGVG